MAKGGEPTARVEGAILFRSPERGESSVMGGYLDVKVCVFQVQRTEPVPYVNLRGDLLQRDHPEQPSHEGVIQASEIEDVPEATILFGDEEVTAVKA